jgi:hypothetical protein
MIEDSMTEYFNQEHTSRRAVVVVGLLGIAVVHLLDMQGKLSKEPFISWSEIVLTVVCLLLAESMIRYDHMWLWLAAGLVSSITISSYLFSRTTGLPGDGGEDKHNWAEPLALTSLLIEAEVLLLVLGHAWVRRNNFTMGTVSRDRKRRRSSN